MVAAQRPVRDEAAFKARARAAASVREKLLEVLKKLRKEVEATIARRVIKQAACKVCLILDHYSWRA